MFLCKNFCWENFVLLSNSSFIILSQWSHTSDPFLGCNSIFIWEEVIASGLHYYIHLYNRDFIITSVYIRGNLLLPQFIYYCIHLYNRGFIITSIYCNRDYILTPIYIIGSISPWKQWMLPSWSFYAPAKIIYNNNWIMNAVDFVPYERSAWPCFPSVRQCSLDCYN